MNFKYLNEMDIENTPSLGLSAQAILLRELHQLKLNELDIEESLQAYSLLDNNSTCFDEWTTLELEFLATYDELNYLDDDFIESNPDQLDDYYLELYREDMLNGSFENSLNDDLFEQPEKQERQKYLYHSFILFISYILELLGIILIKLGKKLKQFAYFLQN
ncbi:hypothetical protein [Thioflexithrix psekupsensis]|uniref:Uncharacterized protein n=1 Tax=Thioflexithrix psekupsensis TaxID=1570016 RepID=A0A251X8B7_9GAMM|nr:hypothetical protein [Thioflexithrix psekupsensis]OUD13782.1 hypothetical protein TPSD3_05365 [Thioflexithrix psekupsensis]